MLNTNPGKEISDIKNFLAQSSEFKKMQDFALDNKIERWMWCADGTKIRINAAQEMVDSINKANTFNEILEITGYFYSFIPRSPKNEESGLAKMLNQLVKVGLKTECFFGGFLGLYQITPIM